MFIPRVWRIPSLALLTLGLVGCGTFGGNNKFACPHPNGVTCMSVTDVYGATNDADEVLGVDPREARKDAAEGRPAGRALGVEETLSLSDPMPAQVRSGQRSRYAASYAPPMDAGSAVDIQGDTLALSALPQPGSLGEANSRQDVNEPYRVPAKVLRIYVRPWQDSDGDLHMGSYIYSELKARTWSVARAVEPATPRTFQLLSPPTPAAQAKPSSTRPSAGSSGPPTEPGPPPGDRPSSSQPRS